MLVEKPRKDSRNTQNTGNLRLWALIWLVRLETHLSHVQESLTTREPNNITRTSRHSHTRLSDIMTFVWIDVASVGFLLADQLKYISSD